MSQQGDKKKTNTQAGPGGNVASLPSKCKAEGCAKKSEKADFCTEHFDWFKEGLITKEGKKPVDFERKFYHYSRRKAA